MSSKTGALKLKGNTPWLSTKKKKKKKTKIEREEIIGADGKPIDPSSISVLTQNTYDKEFAYEMEKLKACFDNPIHM